MIPLDKKLLKMMGQIIERNQTIFDLLEKRLEELRSYLPFFTDRNFFSHHFYCKQVTIYSSQLNKRENREENWSQFSEKIKKMKKNLFW